MSNTDPTKTRLLTNVLAMGKQFLFPIRHLSWVLIVMSDKSLVLSVIEE